jgi:hypothetical protein
MVWVRIVPPPEAVMVSVPDRADAPGAAVIVSVLLPLPGAAMLVGERLAVTPWGAPVTDNAMAELNPLTTTVETVICIIPPGATFTLVALGVSVREKFGVRMVRVSV